MRRELLAGLLLAGAPIALAWKPTTHQQAAVEGAAGLPSTNHLRGELLNNERYLRGGAMGPDLWYPRLELWRYSDLAHYCETDTLAQNMLSRATTPQQLAFAYGWLSHNVADSVAHPWVNDFVGGPFRDMWPPSPEAAKINGSHFLIEAWVDGQLFARGSPSIGQRGDIAKSVLGAVDVYFEPQIQQLLIGAYNATYGAGNGCRYTYKVLTPEKIEAGASWTWAVVAHDKLSAVLPDIIDLDLKKHIPVDLWQLLQATWPDYFSRTVQYVTRAFTGPGPLPNFNLDMGVEKAASNELSFYWGPVLDPNNAQVGVFPVPARRYNNGEKPDYQNRCGEVDCSSSPLAKVPDNPDDATTPACALSTVPANGANRLRLAAKKGAGWALRAQSVARLARSVIDAPDGPAAYAALQALDAEAAMAASTDDRYRMVMVEGSREETLLSALNEVAILDGGFADTTKQLVSSVAEPNLLVSLGSVSGALAPGTPLLVAPSGALTGADGSEQARKGLRSYVSAGGTLLVFSQQRSWDYAVIPTPSGEPIRGWGWFEDNSCWWNAAYVETFHPILASQKTALVTAAFDGFFDGIPEESIILLRRTKNSMPAMFMYPYGQGWVIVSSSYDDWGGYNQAGSGARAIIRDAIAWAKKPADLPLHAPGGSASLELTVRNLGPAGASQVKLLLMSPARDRIVSEQTVPAAVPAGGSSDVPFSYTFPANAELGIYHVDYELLSASGETLQPVSEDDTGRIVVAQPPDTSSYRPPYLQATILMPDGEETLLDYPTRFVYRLSNSSASAKRLHTYWEINHGVPQFLEELTIGAHETAEREVVISPTATLGRFWLHVFEERGPERVQDAQSHVPSEPWPLALSSGKGFRARPIKAKLTVPRDLVVRSPGEVVDVPVAVQSFEAVPWSGLLRLTGRDGVSVEQSITVPASTTWQGTLSVTIPTTRPRSDDYFDVVLLVGARALDRAGWAVKVAVPDPRSVSLSQPTWSRDGGNVVSWTVENPAAVPITAGTLRAELRDERGAILWESEGPLVLAPQEAQPFTWTLPALGPDYRVGRLVLRADSGYQGGRPTVESKPVVARLTGVAGAIPILDAGQASAAALSLRNDGSAHESGFVTGGIEGFGAFAPQAIDMLPGGTADLSLPFTVPVDSRGGPHSGYVDVPGLGRLTFAAVVRNSHVEIEIPAGPFTAGQTVQTTFRNTGGARTTQDVLVRMTHATLPAPPISVSAPVTLDPGKEQGVSLALPEQIAAGAYLLSASAAAQESSSFVRSERSVSISGTSASLTVAMDQEVYAQGAPSLATVTLTNGPDVPLSGLLRVEVASPCDTSGGELHEGSRRPSSAAGTGIHVSVWDGSTWVERGIRGFGPNFEWDVVDLAGVAPPEATELRVRLTHNGSEYGRLDYVALMSAGALHEPTEALYGTTDALPWLVSADASFITLAGEDVMLRFAPGEAPALVLRSAEGTPVCPGWIEWERTWPVSMAPSATEARTVTTPAPWFDGEYVARAYVLNRDGVHLVEASDQFLVVSNGLTIVTEAPPPLVRGSQGMTFSGLVRNVGLADEPDLVLRVSIQRDSYGSDDILAEAFGLSAGAEHPFAVTFTPADFGVSEGEFNLVARVGRASDPSYALTVSSALVRAGEPIVQAELVAPTPMVKLAATGVVTVEADAGDMDVLMGPGLEDLTGPLPFPVTLGGQIYDRFRQSALGFVELVPVGAPAATGTGGICLGDLNNPQGAMLAGLLAFYDTSQAGFIGHQLYGAGETDGTGREFPSDTLVFFWHAPVAGGGPTEINRVQLLLARDGLVRADVVAPFTGLPCGQSTGVVVPPSVLPAPSGLGLTFGLRLETGVGRDAFAGEVRLRNAGTFPGSVTVEHGREGGPRQVETVTLPAHGAHEISFSGQITQDTTYTALVTGDLDTALARTVTVSQGLLVRYSGPEAFEPGPARLPVRVAKLGGVAGPVTVAFRLTTGSASQTLVRTYDLEPGFWFDDALDFDLVDGSAELTAESTDTALAWEGPGPLLIAPITRVEMTVTPASVSGGVWPLVIDVVNSGIEDFGGEVQAIGPSGPRKAVLVAAGDTTTASLDIDLAGATPGPNAYSVRLVDSTGNVVHEEAVNVEVLPAQLGVVATPDGQSFPSGGWRDLVFRVRNTGHQRGSANLWMTVFDEERQQQVDLAPGADTDVTFRVYVDEDVEAKVYVLRYGLDLPGLPRLDQEARIQIEGIQLTVNAALDQPAYAPGATAHFSVSIQNDSTGLGAEYLVRVHYADFDETRTVVVDPAANETFDIPLPAITGEPVFLGITHPQGRSLYINTYHLWAADPAVRVTLDASVYAPGATVGIEIVPAVAGSLTLTGPGYSETLEVTGPTSRGFTLAGDIPGGTQFVSWSFSPTAGGAGAGGQVPFDVSGLRVRVFEARLDQGRYETGDTMKSRLLINANRPASVTLRGFLVDPEGGTAFLGEVPLGLDPQEDLLDVRSWPMASVVAGMHRFTYGIYQGENLLASGSVAFDVGPAAVLGVRTDKYAYPVPGETVQATVVLFVSSPATLELDVDDQSAATRELSQTGIVEIEVPITGPPPGRHSLVARAVGGGYTSERRTPFEYGTSLPDLVVSPALGRAVTPAGEWRLGVTVTNAGPTAAAATTVTLAEAGVTVGSATVPALAAGGSSELQVDWNVLGAAGSHEIRATVDPSDVVTEFSEDNNESIATVVVPSLAMGVSTASSYPANTDASFTLNVTNMTAGSSYSGLAGTVSITRPDTSVFALPVVGVPDVGPLGSVTAAALWAVGQSEPGVYGVSAELADSGGAVVARGLTSFQVTPTIALGGTVSATPNPVGVGEPLLLQGHLANSGNVAADGTATFELVAADQTIAASFGTPAAVPMGGGTDVSVDVPALDVTPADYSLRLGLDVAGTPYPAAASTLTVSGPPVQSALAGDFSPRILAYVGGQDVDPIGWARRTAFLAESLAGLRLTTTGNPQEFGRFLRSGTWNTYVIMNSSGWPLPEFAHDLREAAHRGEGLVWAQWSAGSTGRLTPALGAILRGSLPILARTIVLDDSPLGAAQSLQVTGPMSRLELAGATPVGAASGTQSTVAVAINSFGSGQSVTFALDPAVAPSDPARPALLQLFAAAVAYVAPDSARQVRAGVVVPLSFSVSNPTGLTVDVELTAQLPAGVTVAAVDDSPTQTEPPTWLFSLAPQETRKVRFAVALPDGAGTHSVSSTLRLNGVASQSPPALTLDVATGMNERLADVHAVLEGTAVSPEDQPRLTAALEGLEKAASVRPNPPTSFGLQVDLAGLATEQLGLISSADVSEAWVELDYLMAGWARAWFAATPSRTSAAVASPADRRDPRRREQQERGLRSSNHSNSVVATAASR